MSTDNYSKDQPIKQSNPLLDAALYHAGRGQPVFPCGPDKKPLTPHGFKDASLDPAVINRWFKNDKNRLIGLPTGINFWVLDVDRKNGVDGLLTLETLRNGEGYQVGPLQLTPSGGYHMLFALPPDMIVPSNAGAITQNGKVSGLGPGLDLRGQGAYICTGPGYSWVEDYPPDAPLSQAPSWLLTAIRKLKAPATPNKATGLTPLPPAGDRTDAAGYWLTWALARAAVGNRNATGFALACQLRDAGLSMGEAESVMRQYAGQVQQSAGNPYGDGEAMATLKSAWVAPRREAATLPGGRKLLLTDKQAVRSATKHALEAAQLPPEPDNFPDDGAPVDPPAGDLPDSEPGDQPQPARNKFKSRPLSTAFEPKPPKQWRVHNLILDGSVTILAGAAGSGKTWALLALAGAVAVGDPWCGYTTESGPVLWLDLQSGVDRHDERLKRICEGHGIGLDAPIRSINPDGGFDISSAGDLAALQSEIFETGAKLLFIDALMDILPTGTNENDSTAMNAALIPFRGIAQRTKCAVVVIHHANRAGAYRGSSAIPAACDLQLGLKTEDGINLMFSMEKCRDIARTSFVGALHFSPNDGPVTFAPSVSPLTTDAGASGAVLAALSDGAKSLVAIQAACPGFTDGTVKEAIRKLAAVNAIINLGGPPPKKALYQRAG